jgi:hypothetical protein
MWQIRNLPIVDKSTRLGAKAEQSHHNNRRAAATSLGSGLIDQSQKRTAAAMQIAEK